MTSISRSTTAVAAPGPPGRTFRGILVGLALVLSLWGCRSMIADGGHPAEGKSATAEQTLSSRWGVEVVGLRLTAADHMLDFRYRVLDAEKAAPLFVRATKPELIHIPTGAKLPVFSPTKTGPLRNTNTPIEGRVYFMFFPNPGFVHAGDQASLHIGDFQTDLHVE